MQYRFAWKFDKPVSDSWLIENRLSDIETVHENGYVVCIKEGAWIPTEAWMKAEEEKGGYLSAVRTNTPLGYYVKEDGVWKLRHWGKEWFDDNLKVRLLENPTYDAVLDLISGERPFVPHYSIPLNTQEHDKWHRYYNHWTHSKAKMVYSGLLRRQGRKKETTPLQRFIGPEQHIKRGGAQGIGYPQVTKKLEQKAETSPFWASYEWLFKHPWRGDKWVYKALMEFPKFAPELPAHLSEVGPGRGNLMRYIPNGHKENLLAGMGSRILAVWLVDPERGSWSAHDLDDLDLRGRHLFRYLPMEIVLRLRSLRGLERRMAEIEQVRVQEDMQRRLEREGDPDEPIGITLTALGVAESFPIRGYQFTLLRTPRQIIEEGKEQAHCAGMFVGAVKAGHTTLWKIEGRGERATAEIQVEHRFTHLSQLYGKYNAPIEGDLRTAAEELADIIQDHLPKEE